MIDRSWTHTLGVLAFVAAGATTGCVEDELVDGLYTPAQWEVINTLTPLPPPPPDPTNRFADNAAAAELGQMLFFDKSMAGALAIGDDGMNGGLGAVGEEGAVSCGSCHNGPWFDDQRSNPNNVSLGADWGMRNSPSVVNSAHYEWYNWDGGADSMWAQVLGAASNPLEQNVTQLGVAHAIYTKYRAEYEDLTGTSMPDLSDSVRFPPGGSPKTSAADPDGDWESMTTEDQRAVTTVFVDFGKVIAAYERLLVSGNSPFDRYVAGETNAVSASAKRGLALFVGKANCVECHNTPAFADNGFHNLGVPQVGEYIPAQDAGRHAAVALALAAPFSVDSEWSDDPTTGKLDGLNQSDGQIGQFRTKQLRHIAKTGPYMHTGGFATLREVVEFYDSGAGDALFVGTKDQVLAPLNLTDREIDDIVAFLESLTGEGIAPELLEDTSRP